MFRMMSKQRTIVSVALTGRDLLVLWVRNVFITARKRSCGKVMFLHLSVILFIAAGGEVWLWVQGVCLLVLGDTHPPLDTSSGHTPLITHPLNTPSPGHTPLDTPSHTPPQHTLWTHPPPDNTLLGHPPTPEHPRNTTVNKQAVRILLECVLVWKFVYLHIAANIL